MSAGIFWDETERTIKKPEEYEWEWGPPTIQCGKCHVRINNIPDKYGVVYCNNGHRNVRPKSQ